MRPRLQLVLELRRGAEDAARRALGERERERAAIISERAVLEHGLAEAANAPVAFILREQLSAYAAAARAAAFSCDQRLAEQDKRIDEARNVVAEAHRGVRAIEALQERDRAAAARRERRHEGRGNDAFAARTHQGSLS